MADKNEILKSKNRKRLSTDEKNDQPKKIKKTKECQATLGM